ncbi:MAG: dTMP kinase [Chloroflexi bacterium RBG_16_54_18]|nr:MAG: dTMP kinase [Chloroflexi bacterium RBG_16_54_18]
MRDKGFFITLEGPEGSGKTYQLLELVKFLQDLGWPVLPTREPGGTPIGDQIREVLSNLDNKDMRPRTEILLFQASRAQLVDTEIIPFLRIPGIVVSDRYADSTLAYQGYGHGIDRVQLQAIVDFATQGLKPDLTLLLDIDVRMGLQRKKNGGEWNRLDAYDVKFHERARQGYHELAMAEPERWVIIDAGLPPRQVQSAMQAVVKNRMQEQRLGVES